MLIEVKIGAQTEIEFAHNGEKAMEMIKANCKSNGLKNMDYSLIITDLSMKPTDGLQLTQ